MRNLFILGIKHSGKTTFACLLAEKLHIQSIDSDDLIAERIKPLSVREYFREHGENNFKEMESTVVREYLEDDKGPLVMSLGGGASDNEVLIKTIKEHGYLIYLRRKESDMLPVILKHGIPAFLDENDLEGSFHQLYKRRDSIYLEISDKVIDMGPYRDREETLEAMMSELGDLIT